LGIGGPCFANHAPTPIKEFLRSMPRLDGKNAFVFATSGGAPGRVLYDMTRFLRIKGGNVIGGFLSRGQVYYPAPSLVGRYPNRPNEDDLARARDFAISIAEHVSADRAYPLPEGRLDALKARWGPYYILGIIFSDSVARLLVPKPEIVESMCDQCGWCVKECPVDNISLKSYPLLGKRCICCYRCLTGCPRKAFEADWRFINPVIAIVYSIPFQHWFGDVKKGEAVY